MIDFMKNHWQVIFGGIGTAIIVFFLGLLVHRGGSGKVIRETDQSAKAGTNSQILQAGRDVTNGNLMKGK